MFHIVESCPLTKLNGGLSRLHSADKDTFVADQLWFMTRIREEEESHLCRRHACQVALHIIIIVYPMLCMDRLYIYLCVRVRHTFCQLAYRSDPSTDLYS